MNLTLQPGPDVHQEGDKVLEAGPEQDQVTKNKMERLRRIMDEQKARRRARREAAASKPYSTSWSLKSTQSPQEQLAAAAAVAASSAAATTTADSEGVISAANSSGKNSDNKIFNKDQLDRSRLRQTRTISKYKIAKSSKKWEEYYF